MVKYSNKKHKPWKMLVYLFLIQLFIAFVARSIAPLGIVIGEDLQLTMAEIGMFPAALFLGQSLVSMPAGMLTDKVGSRRMILYITLILSGSFFVMSFASSFVLIMMMIVISGIAYGASHPTTNRGIVYWFKANERGTAMGFKQMGVTLGSASAALLLLPLASHLGWQIAVLVASLSLLIIGLIIYLVYHEPEQHTYPSSGKGKSANILSLLRNKGLMLVTFSAMLLSGSQMILNTFIVLFAHERLEISLVLSGVLLGVAEVGGSLGRLCWGIISDRFFAGKRVVVLLLISILVAIQSVITSLLPVGTSFYVVAIVVFIFGLGTSGFNGVWMNATTEMVQKSSSGIATGVSITFGSWGAILFPPIFGSIVDWTDSFSFGWIFVMFLMIMSIISLSFVKKLTKEPEQS
ncbi:MFS transporter [Oceanobacillus sp. Castelsardo]|uniref:MFS transporter n=1 Tax=Oceanobacillus sp. Castelsardo TaxID=1851204 RepID=UPI000838FBBA|nr:MFS transporter [Oceanobacillus sp. Castelsardo]